MAWKDVTIGDIVSLQRGYDLTEQDRTPGTVPVYGSFGITGWHNVARASGPGVTIGRSGASFGVVNYSPRAYWPHNTTLFVTDFKGNDERFVYYLLRSIDFSSLNSGSAQPSLNRNFLYPLRIRIPTATAQRQIAAVLSAYDDLIENNTRRIAILEEMARRIYEEWFVSLRFPGHENVRVIESEVGPVPEGWSVEGLYDVAMLTYGFPFKSKMFEDDADGVGVVRIRDIKLDRASTRTIEIADRKFRIADGDILIGMDGEFHMGRWAGGDAWLNQRVVRLKPVDGISRSWLFWVTERPIKLLEATIVGTTVAHLSASDLKAMRLLRPNVEIMGHVARVLDPLFDLELILKKKNAKARATRDLLLPKLISGELDVSSLREPETAVV